MYTLTLLKFYHSTESRSSAGFVLQLTTATESAAGHEHGQAAALGFAVVIGSQSSQAGFVLIAR